MTINKFKEIQNKIYRNIHAITENDMRLIKDILSQRDIEYGRIKGYSVEDSKVLALYTLKHNAVILLDFVFRNGVGIGDDMCTVLCEILLGGVPVTSAECSLEVEEVKAQMDGTIIDILCDAPVGPHVERIQSYLSEQEVPDRISINLAAVFTAPQWKSYDLRVVNELILGPVLVGLLKSFKGVVRGLVRDKIIGGCKKKLGSGGDRNVIYQIFYEMNSSKDMSLFEIDEEEKEESYVGFIYSLMVDEESCVRGYEVISKANLFNDLRRALETISTLSQGEYRRIRPEDERLIYHLLEVMRKVVCRDDPGLSFIRLYFMRFIEQLLSMLVGQTSLEIKGVIYGILCGFMYDEDCRDTISEFMKGVRIFSKEAVYTDFERELAAKTFPMAPSFLEFCMFLEGKEALGFAMYALRSEDPETVMGCLNVIERFVQDKAAGDGARGNVGSQLLLMAQHIRAAMLRDPQVVSRVVDYQLSTRMVINDVSVINVVVSTPLPRFFQYVRLFDDFSFFMNENFLERLAENECEGFGYLSEVTGSNHEACKFVMNNEDWFNAYVKDNSSVWGHAVGIYENLVDYDIENVDVSFDRGFIIPDVVHPSVFRILGKLILHSVYVKKTPYSSYITDKDYELGESAIKEYCNYIKCRIVVGDNVEERIKYLMRQYDGIDDLLGYYKVTTDSQLDVSSKNLLLNIDKKDTALFISLFPTASTFEKFLLFFLVGDITPENSRDMERIMKEEVTRITISGSVSPSERLILRQCLVTLLSLNNIDSIVRLVAEYEDVDLLMRINIRNLVCGGSYFNSSLVMKGSLDLQICAVFLLHYRSVWDLTALRDWILHLRQECKDDENLEYLLNDIKSKNLRIELE